MKMFLDCLYLVCCNLYKKKEPESFKVSGVIILAGAFMLNVLLLSIIIEENISPLKKATQVYEWRYFLIPIPAFIFISILYYRYFKVTSYENVHNKISSSRSIKHQVSYFLAILYLILSYAGFIFFVAFEGGKVNGWW